MGVTFAWFIEVVSHDFIIVLKSIGKGSDVSYCLAPSFDTIYWGVIVDIRNDFFYPDNFSFEGYKIRSNNSIKNANADACVDVDVDVDAEPCHLKSQTLWKRY